MQISSLQLFKKFDMKWMVSNSSKQTFSPTGGSCGRVSNNFVVLEYVMQEEKPASGRYVGVGFLCIMAVRIVITLQ